VIAGNKKDIGDSLVPSVEDVSSTGFQGKISTEYAYPAMW